MSSGRITHAIIATLVKDQLYHPTRLYIDMIIMFGRCGVLLLVYAYVFRLRDGVVNGVTYDVVAWSMFMFFAFGLLNMRELSRRIMQDVRSGAVEMLINKPISYMHYRFAWQIGAGLISFIVISAIGGAVLVYAIGVPAVMKTHFFMLTWSIVFFCGLVLSALLYMIIGYLAFWIEDINPVHWLVDKSIMVLGGSYLPIAFFPQVMRDIAIWSPFGASQLITHTTHMAWQAEWMKLVGIQIMWIVICGIILYMLNDRAQKNLSINGG